MAKLFRKNGVRRASLLFACAFTCAASALLVNALPASALTFEQEIEVRALQFQRTGNYKEANRLWRELLRRQPNNPRLLTEVGNSYYEDSSNLALGVIESEKYFRQAIKVEPGFGAAYIKLAKWYNSKGNYAEGIRLSTIGINAKYPDYSGLVERAGAYSNLHKDKEALADIDRFIKRGNGEKLQVLRRASIYENLHQYDKALADYQSVLKKNYEDQVVFRELICLQKLGRNDEALQEVNKLIARNKIDDAGYLARARLYSKMGKQKEAIADFSRVIELGETTTIYKERAREYEKIGRKDLAAKDLKSADRVAAEGI